MATIRELRTRQDMSQAALALKSGISLSILQRYEAGVHEPTIGRLRLIAESLGVTVDEITWERTPKREKVTA